MDQTVQQPVRKPPSFVDNGDKKFELLCTVVGDSWSGKTAFVEHLLFDSKAAVYYATTLDLYVSTGLVEVLTEGMLSFRKTKKFKLWMTDTAGDGHFDMLRQIAYKNPSIVLVMLDVTSEYSINSIEERWMAEVEYNTKDLPFPPDVFLVGTHIDSDKKILIGKREGIALAERVGARAFVECNCMDAASVLAAWTAILRQVNVFVRLVDKLRVVHDEQTLQLRARAPRDACSAGHVGWDTHGGRGFVQHCVPGEWRSFLAALSPLQLAPLRYPNRFSRRRSAQAVAVAPPTLEITGLDGECMLVDVVPEPEPAAAAPPPRMVLAVQPQSGPGALSLPTRPARRGMRFASAASDASDLSDHVSDSESVCLSDGVSVGSEADDAEDAAALDLDAVPPGPVAASPDTDTAAKKTEGSRRHAHEQPQHTVIDWQQELKTMLKRANEYEWMQLELSTEYFNVLDQACDAASYIESLTQEERWTVTHRLATAYSRASEMQKQAKISSSQAYQLLKVAKRRLQDPTAALYPARVAAERFDLLGGIYQKMAWMLRSTGKLDASLVCLNKAVEAEKNAAVERMRLRLSPRSVPAASTHLHLTVLLSQLGRHADALHHAQLAVAKMSVAAVDLPCDGESSLRQREADADAALNVLLGIPRRGSLAVAYHNVGVELQHLNQTEKAIESYQSGYDVAVKQLGQSHKLTQLLWQSLKAAQQTVRAQESRLPQIARRTHDGENSPRASLPPLPTRSGSVSPVASRRFATPSPPPTASPLLQRAVSKRSPYESAPVAVTLPPMRPSRDAGVLVKSPQRTSFGTGSRSPSPIFSSEPKY